MALQVMLLVSERAMLLVSEVVGGGSAGSEIVVGGATGDVVGEAGLKTFN